MRFLRQAIDNLYELIERNKYLKAFKPVLNATDEFFFGTDKVTSLPHILDPIDIKRFMSFVIIGLLPATIAAVYFWGMRVIALILVSYIFGGIVEVAFAVSRKKEIHEGFLVTGLIFPLILPPTAPLWIVAIGVMFGVVFGKEAFGGTGRNIFNPALAGRVFLSVAFPGTFTNIWQEPISSGLGGFIRYKVDAVTSATPLINFKGSHILADMPSLLMGSTAGSIGETFRIGIIIGGLFLIIGMIYERRHTRLIDDFGGIAKVMPLYAAFVMIIVFSSIGLPSLFKPG